MMTEMMITNEFADVTLVSEDRKYVKAHRNILSACSPVLKDILSMDKSSSTFIYLRGIQHSELHSILQYIYLGEATLSTERINEFLEVARILEIKSLQKDAKTEPCTFNEDGEPITTFNAQEIGSEIQKVREKITTITNEQDSDLETDTLNGDEEESTTTNEQETASNVEANITDEEEQTNTTNEQEAGSNVEIDNNATVKEKQTITMNEQEMKYFTIKSQLKSFKKAKDITNEFVKAVRIGDEVVYTCKQCDHGRWSMGSKSISKGDLKRHIKAKHLNVRYDCQECPYQAKYSGDLKKHIRITHIDPQLNVRYDCHECAYQAKNTICLKRHIIKKHQ